ncbi:MAG: redoxin domain-containing protein [Deltaproteobacteria bacterium]|nr:redoxin domain-containing protein [Deltaproteobacteria bacterium]
MSPGQPLRLALVIGLGVSCLSVAAWALWHEDGRFGLPTPRPPGLVQPEVATTLVLPQALADAVPRGQGPVLLHFFNPDCPCSRFNLPHLEELKLKYGKDVRIVGLVEGEFAAGKKLLGELGIPLVDDESGALANAVGVYSTPQAVILDGQGKLRYRGNYNAARYCDDPETQYARLALEAVLAEAPVALPVQASIAYGCELPRGHR